MAIGVGGILCVGQLVSFRLFRLAFFAFCCLAFSGTIILPLSIYLLSRSFCSVSMSSGSCWFRTLSFSLNLIKPNMPLVLSFVCSTVSNDSYLYDSSFSLTVANFILPRISCFMSYCFQCRSLFIVLVMALLLFLLLLVIFACLRSMLYIMYCLDSIWVEFWVGLVFSIIC